MDDAISLPEECGYRPVIQSIPKEELREVTATLLWFHGIAAANHIDVPDRVAAAYAKLVDWSGGAR